MTAEPTRKLHNTSAAIFLVEQLHRLGCPGVVLCPGSRSTPLVGALAHFGALPLRILHDERSAGFFALGWARASGRPVAIVTTSGTAVANLLPAFVEADRDRVPMLALTADRPFESHGTDANQTVNQRAFLSVCARHVLNLPPPEDLVSEAEIAAVVEQAYQAALGPVAGPAQLNCMFRKPLEPDAEWLARRPRSAIPARQALAAPRRDATMNEPSEAAALASIASRLQAQTRGIVMLGATRSLTEAQGALELARTLDWPLIACALANAWPLDEEAPHTRPVAYIGQGAILAKAGCLPAPPDTVCWLGGPMLFPELTNYVTKARQIIRIDPDHRPPSETMQPDEVLTCSAQTLVETLPLKTPSRTNDWTEHWRELEAVAVAEARHALWEHAPEPWESGSVRAQVAAPEQPLDEPAIASLVLQSMPRDGALFVGNSMPIRDIALFSGARQHRCRIFANRGASGIDGLISTAAGIACHEGQTVALLGDLSFLYDAGVCSALGQADVRLRIVVVANGGGGIFDFLPIAEHRELLDRFFYTPHQVDICQLMSAYGIPCTEVVTRQALWHALQAPPDRLEVIVARSDRAQNVRAHQQRYQSLRQAIDRAAPGTKGQEST